MTWRLLHDAVWWGLAIAVTVWTGSLLAGLAVVAAVALIEDYGL